MSQDQTCESSPGEWCPNVCPITFRPFFMWIEHPELGRVPTYGGPYDSYTIPEPDNIPEKGKIAFHDITFTQCRFDHDQGCWTGDAIDPGMRVTTEEALLDLGVWDDEKEKRVKEAAPDLLAVLEEFIAADERAVSEMAAYYVPPPEYVALHEKARAAIQKATGEESA